MAEDKSKQVPDWIDEFTEEIGHYIDTGTVPVAYSVWGPDDREAEESLDDPWLVHFYPTLSEMVGGPHDGTHVFPSLSADVISLQETIEDIEFLYFMSQSRHHEQRYKGAALVITGWYHEHPVDLRVFEIPPDDADVEAIIYHQTGMLRIKDPSRLS